MYYPSFLHISVESHGRTEADDPRSPSIETFAQFGARSREKGIIIGVKVFRLLDSRFCDVHTSVYLERLERFGSGLDLICLEMHDKASERTREAQASAPHSGGVKKYHPPCQT